MNRSIRLRDEIDNLVRPWGRMQNGCKMLQIDKIDRIDRIDRALQGLEIPTVSRIFRPGQRLRACDVKNKLKIHLF